MKAIASNELNSTAPGLRLRPAGVIIRFPALTDAGRDLIHSLNALIDTVVM